MNTNAYTNNLHPLGITKTFLYEVTSAREYEKKATKQKIPFRVTLVGPICFVCFIRTSSPKRSSDIFALFNRNVSHIIWSMLHFAAAATVVVLARCYRGRGALFLSQSTFTHILWNFIINFHIFITCGNIFCVCALF